MDEQLCDWCVTGGCTHVVATHRLTREWLSGQMASAYACDPHATEHQVEFTGVERIGGDQ